MYHNRREKSSGSCLDKTGIRPDNGKEPRIKPGKAAERIVKERKYKEDWVSETRLDGKTGREKQGPVYRGSWFTAGGGQKKKELLLRSLLPWSGFLALLLLYFFLNYPGSRILYIFLPAALSLFPCLYWAMGVWGIFRAPDKMTRVQKETGIGRVLRSSAACVILCCAALIGEIIFLFTGSDAAREWPGALMLLAAAALAFVTAAYFRNVIRSLSEERSDA